VALLIVFRIECASSPLPHGVPMIVRAPLWMASNMSRTVISPSTGVGMEHCASAIRPWRLVIALFCISYATALFALAIFKLLSFFVMPSLFFDLLFIGFPLGAWLGARVNVGERRSLIRALWCLEAIMAASVASCLLAKRFDYLRAHLFDIELSRLIAQVGMFVLMFLPFFAAYGLCEFAAYQVGRRALGGKIRPVYALALFGAATAYLSLKALLPMLGMSRVLAVAFGSLALAILNLSRGWSRSFAAVLATLIAAGCCVPGLEGEFLTLYKGRGLQSTWDYRSSFGCREVFQKWGRYSLCEILASPDKSVYYGFYNDMFQWEYAPRQGFREASLGAIPVLLSEPGQNLAIVGAGGGRQVRLAARLEGRRVVAIEVEPAVFEAVRSPDHLLGAFGRVYEAPGVTPVRTEARGYLEKTDQKFDLIYLPSVGGYPQMMIEPGNMVRTVQAYRTMRDRLTDHGMLAIWYPCGLDTKGILTEQYVRTLRSLGMKTEAYRNRFEFLIIALRDGTAQPPQASDLGQLLTMGDQSYASSSLYDSLRPAIYPVADDPGFVPITDQKPYLAGNLRYVLSISQVFQLFALAAGVLALCALAVWFGLRRQGDPMIPGRPFAAVAVLATLIGANFLMIEHTLVLAIFRRLYVFDDALTLGAVGFLTLSGLGSLLTAPRLRRAIMIAAAVGILVFLCTAERLTMAGALIVGTPIALATGMFFPALFELAAANPLAVFAFDAIGAGLGAVAATFIPIAWGIDTFFIVAGIVFVVTFVDDVWFHITPVAKVPAYSGSDRRVHDDSCAGDAPAVLAV
jgi:hypothetical protein